MNASTRVSIRAVILAAGIGSRIRPLTDDRPKSLLEVDGVSILRRMVSLLRSCGIRRILVVVGYRQDQVRSHLRECFPDLQIGFVVNDLYASTNTAYSLWLARHALIGEELVKLDADVVFERRILDRLLRVPGNAICVDTSIRLADEEVKVAIEGSGRVLQIGKHLDPCASAGESIGIEKIGAHSSRRLFEVLSSRMAREKSRGEYYERAYEELIEAGIPFEALDITGCHWTEVDTHQDLDLARELFSSRVSRDRSPNA